MSRTLPVSLCLCFSFCTIDSSQAEAAVVLPTLPAGTQYQIIFRTEDTISGSISSIATFNNMATSEAALSPGLPVTTWHAVISTASIAANVNAPSPAVPVFNTQGQLIAPASLYGTHVAGVNYDQFGNGWNPSDHSIFVWTGSHADGTPNLPLGSSPNVTAGDVVTYPGYFWAEFGNEPRTDSRPIYALSGVLVAVPEPASIALAISALAAVPFVWRRRFSRRA